MRAPPSRRQAGVTLTELMIALVLGALVVLAATAMVATSRGTYRTQDESTRLAESARFGLELGNRLVRLAGYTNWGDDYTVPASYVADPAWAAAPDAYAMNGPNIVGANNSKPGGAAGINYSDALTIRFYGASPANSPLADGNVLDCAGTAVPAPPAQSAQAAATVNDNARAANTLYVDYDVDGEPSLFCKRQTYDPTTGLASGTDTQVLIRGVEDFQVLFGEYVLPVAVPPVCPTLDDTAPQNIVYRTGIGGSNVVASGLVANPPCTTGLTTNWGNVRAVRIAMLLRSNVGARADPEPTTTNYYLFGPDYPASNDPGTAFSLSGMSVAERTRVRRIVQTTVFVRNRESGWSSINYN